MKKTELISKAYAKYIRVSPRKMRLVIDLVRGEKVDRALVILVNLNKGAKVYVQKLITSAVSNAKSNPAVSVDQLFISKITADNGPVLKRFRAAAMGRATTIRHRTTHLTVELAQRLAGTVKINKKTVRPFNRKIRKGKVKE